jgi:hypothetical protein
LKTKELIYKLNEVFSKSIPNTKYSYEPSEKTDILIAKFFDKFEKDGVHRDSMGVSFLYDYFCYSYQCMTAFGADLRPVPLNWVVGVPQYKRWKEKPDSYHYLIQEGILSNIKITPLSELKKIFRSNTTSFNISEEYERQRFYNTAEGFVNCILSTSLCDESSEWCEWCINKNDCISELKIRDKRTALLRGYIKL